MKIKLAALSGIATLLVSTAALAEIKIAEGTEFPVRLEEAISSSSATEGDRFTIVLDDDVKLPDGTVLRAGYRGVGEVVEARDNGMLGKNGKLNVRLNYLKVGDERVVPDADVALMMSPIPTSSRCAISSPITRPL